jgi:hypothetical protein
MRRHLIGCSAAGVLALAASVAAQNPPPTPETRPQTSVPTTQSAPATVEGCLVREQDVPGRKPNVAEKAGVMEDYILTNAKIVKGSAPASQARADQPTGTSGSAAASTMFDVKGIDDARLKQYVGKRVQIDGTFADVNRTATANEDLVDIRGTTIRQATGDCPAK